MKYRLALVAVWAVSALGETSQSPQELLKEAVSFQQTGHLSEAIRDYSLFLDMYPDASQVRSNLGAALVGSGKYAEAIDQYRLALDAKPDPAVRFNLGLAYYKSARFSEAIPELQKINIVDPQSFNATLLLADCYIHLGQNRSAVDLLSPVRETHPDDMGIAYLLGTALIRDGRIEQGQIVIDQIMRRGDSAELHILMGTTAFTARDFQRAVAELSKATQLNPNLSDAWAYYGLSLLATGEVSRSREAFLAALKLDPNDFQSNLNVGLSLRLDNKPADAEPYFAKALSVRPGDLATEFQLALTRLALGRTDEAQRMLEHIVDAAPSFTEAHVSLASVFYRQHRKQDGDRERAIVERLTAEAQAKQPAVRASQQAEAK